MNSSKRILIIDDDLSIRDALKKVLGGIGYTVVLAADGREGVICLEEQEFDLLLLDLDLPKVSGFDVLDVAAERHPALPVLILTGELDQCEPGALVGADALMEKPPDVALLLKTVDELLNEPAARRLRRLEEGPLEARPLPPADGSVLYLSGRAADPGVRLGPKIPFKPKE